ncbi:MAG: response regulator, partial [Desulfobacteraceae bacterium]|nr:response regulator [Desulfobacteraceae bacterium]
DLSKVEAGKLKLDYTPVCIQELFAEMEILFKQKTDNKGLDFIVKIPGDLPKALLLDETRLRQIMVNLISNAVKFTEKGSITLSVQWEFVSDINHSILNLMIWVKDTGMGMPESEKDKIFDSFEQLKTVKTGKFGGTGLGLAITRRLISIMNGQISVESELNKGSSFLILLREVEIAAMDTLDTRQPKQVDPVLIKFKKSTILVADDIEYNRELIKAYLEQYNFTILEAENGKEVIDMLKLHHPDLILLDMKMPQMNGYETAAVLKKDDRVKDIPIIAITASAMKQDEENIRILCNAYLKKPVSQKDLVSEIMKFLPHSTLELESNHDEKSTFCNGFELTHDIITRFPMLLKPLREQQQTCHTLSSLMAIDEIESFAEKIQGIGREHDCELLVTWADELYLSAIQFDMDKLKNMLKNFQTMITKTD